MEVSAVNMRTIFEFLKNYGLCINVPTKIYHYTTLEGLQGIISSNYIRHPDIRYLNDSQEVYDSIKYIKELRPSPAPDFEKGIKEMPHIAYVASFTEVDDSYPHWGLYAQNGQGIAMEFSVSGETNPMNPFIRIIYDDNKKREIVKKIDIDFHDNYPEWVIALSLFSCFTKNNHFEVEKEIRSFVLVEKEEDYDNTLHFATKKNTIVPYVNPLELTINYKLPEITKIIIGPTANEETIENGIKKFLRKNNLGHVPIVKSEVPYRGG